MKSRHLITLALTLPVFYWIYLLFFTQTEIKWDSFDYEHLGQMIIQQGWAEFFRTGPNREPLYPFFLSLVMRLSDFLDIPYLKIMSVLQFTLLFITQCLTLKILQKLNIKPVLCALTVFYIGISPVLINCALSLYSEILIIALIPAAILIFSTIFSQFPKHNSTRIIFAGLILALTLLVLTFTKAIFEIAGPAILLSSFLIVKRIAPSAESFKRFAIMILIACIVFGSILFGYKSINKHFNNNFTLTNRGAWAFYGFAARRLEPITTRQLMAGITFIPGEGACKKFFTEKECYFWSFYTSDYFGIEKIERTHGKRI